ncbi:MAG: bacterioferritin [Pseudonocardia sp.]|jgi:bacterioferritin|uniref:ferritin-like domain-containing protein n=1 Tax=Pseudonocardia sp. TaxID=60912 RepID=UPI0026349BE9|nr:ferritin-like domain-containing protein [Pseudonocardia sp.]MCU1628463.1 bacterioferritin [Pseudonocardia sp.]MDT7700393.1 bacterioferritin [Pseudonocardiales bacterium]
MADFLTDVQVLRDRARAEIDKGPVTSEYGADLDRVLRVLQEALATEIVCVLRYKQHQYAAKGLDAEPVAKEFAEHAGEEQEHADRLAARIAQLGGVPDMNPETLTGRSHSQYTTAERLIDMIKENLVAERVAIASYTEIIKWIGDGDVTTRRIFEEILEVEEEHADDMINFLEQMT